MSSTVCQGLQSCLEPRHVEPRVLIQNLAPQKSTLFQSTTWPQKPNVSQPQRDGNETIHNDINNNNRSSSSYSFLDPIHRKDKDGESFWSSITSQNCKQVPAEAAQTYVHPLVRRSSSSLSTKSLEMCTESLGSETGSSIGESIDDFPSPVPEISNLEAFQRSRPREFPKKMFRSASFPPPLTSISGSEGVKMRPHREGGRLVLEAVSVTSCSPYFKTERSNGRLRLSLLKGSREEEEEEEEAEDMDAMHGEETEQELELELVSQDAEEDDDMDMEMNAAENVGYEVRVGEFPRICKGGGNWNKGIPSWDPFPKSAKKSLHLSLIFISFPSPAVQPLKI